MVIDGLKRERERERKGVSEGEREREFLTKCSLTNVCPRGLFHNEFWVGNQFLSKTNEREFIYLLTGMCPSRSGAAHAPDNIH